MAPHIVAIVDGAVVDPCVDPRVRRFRTLIAIVHRVVHIGRVDGPFCMCFIRHDVRGLHKIS